MRIYPTLPTKQKQNAVIPSINGGLNLRDTLSNVNDNQLTDCLNVWFKDGVLKTRPGFREQSLSGNYYEVFETKKHDVFSEKGQLVSVLCTEGNGYGQEILCLKFFWCGENFESMQEIQIRSIESDSDQIDNYNYCILQKNTKIYCFTEDAAIYMYDSEGRDEWYWMAAWDFYAPKVVINCLSTSNNVSTDNSFFNIANGTQFEGYNLLTNYYKMVYSTGNPNVQAVSFFPFLSFLDDYTQVTVKYTDTSGTYTHTVFYQGSGTVREAEAQGDGLILAVKSNGFWFENNGTTKEFTPSDYIPNNMEVTAAYSQTGEEYSKNRSKVCSMSFATWFGGGNAGYNGGTRAFLGGNKTSGEENLVIWSGLNNPLYFDENNYFYVGTDTTPVTAFGKQSDMLVIFKPGETYYTQYAQNTDITAEDLINQNVVDYQANSVYFPLTLINNSIGCDCPNTVQLCRNRLVWMNSDAKVYSFVVANVYNERTIYEVGEMIHNGLRKIDPDILKKANSADWLDYYFIFIPDIGNTVYLMDYNSNGYQYPYSFGKEEDANKSIPWYKWKLSAGDAAVVFGDKLAVVDHETDGIDKFYYSILSKDFTVDQLSRIDMDDLPITTMMQTKLFDFLQGYRKDITKVGFSIGNNGGYPLEIHYVTDAGTEYDEIEIDSEQTDPHDLGFLTDFPMFPCIKSVLRFGVRIECQAATTFNSLRITYKILGGAK